MNIPASPASLAEKRSFVSLRPRRDRVSCDPRRIHMTMNGFGRAAGWCGRWSLVLVMAVGCGSASGLPGERAGADLDERTRADLSEEAPAANPFVFRVDSEPYGIRITEWAYNWLRSGHSMPSATNPIIIPGALYVN